MSHFQDELLSLVFPLSRSSEPSKALCIPFNAGTVTALMAENKETDESSHIIASQIDFHTKAKHKEKIAREVTNHIS